jgi:hypothetical protein
VLLDLGEGVGVTVIDLDPGAVAEARGRIPVIDHRRVIGAADVTR